MSTLADLTAGQSATILTIQGDDSIALRLMEMGITEGEIVSFLGTAPMGDPIEIQIRGYRLSLRRLEARRVEVCDPKMKAL